jgi:hypothetical protein
VDTRGILNSNWKRLHNASMCGGTLIGITRLGTYAMKMTCKTWDCEKCVDQKISDIGAIIERNIRGPHVFITKIDRIGRRLSNWISTHRRRVPIFFYFSIKTSTGFLLISSHQFLNSPNTQRVGKKNYVDNELHNYLKEHHREVIGVSHSREQGDHGPNRNQRSVNPTLANVFSVDKEREWYKLKTDREKAEWLERTPGKLFAAGREFIREHLGGDNQPI